MVALRGRFRFCVVRQSEKFLESGLNIRWSGHQRRVKGGLVDRARIYLVPARLPLSDHPFAYPKVRSEISLAHSPSLPERSDFYARPDPDGNQMRSLGISSYSLRRVSIMGSSPDS